MGPLQMAKAECANLVAGTCFGIPWQCLGGSRPMVGRERDGCKLSDPKARCEYFEVVIAPLSEYWPDKYADAVRQYGLRSAKHQTPSNGRLCGCGKPMAKRRRMCDACARKNRLAAKRRWKGGQFGSVDS